LISSKCFRSSASSAILDESLLLFWEKDISAQFHEIGIGLNEDGLVTALKKVSAPLVTSVEIDRIGGVQSLHKSTEIRIATAHRKMQVVVHENENVDFRVVKIGCGSENLKKVAAI